MEDLPGWAVIAGNLGGIGLAVWLLFKWKAALEATIAGLEKAIETKDTKIAELHEKVVSAYRETLPALSDASQALEGVGRALPTLIATEPARLTGVKS